MCLFIGKGLGLIKLQASAVQYSLQCVSAKDMLGVASHPGWIKIRFLQVFVFSAVSCIMVCPGQVLT